MATRSLIGQARRTTRTPGKSVCLGSIEKTLLWVFAVSVLGIVAGILLVHLPGETPAGTGDAVLPSRTITTETVARIAEESRGALAPRVVKAAPLPVQDAGSPLTIAPTATTLPDGYSVVAFNGEMARAPNRDGRHKSRQMDDDPDWLRSQTSIERLATQAKANGARLVIRLDTYGTRREAGGSGKVG